MAVAQALDLAVLEHAQQRDLGFCGQIADFVEEDRAAVGRFESSETSLQRARERALLVAEELRRDERGRDGRAVHANERASGPMRLLVDGSRDQLLAAAGFAQDQDRGIGGGDLVDQREHASQGRRRPDDFLEHRRAIDLFAQRDVLVANPVFRLLAIVDVRRRRVPSDDVSVPVAHGTISDQEPAIVAVVTSGSLFVLERLTARERVASFLLKAFDIVGVKHSSAKLGTSRFVTAQAGVLERQVVDVECLSVRAEHRDHLRDHVNDRSELTFGLLQFGECIRERLLRACPLDRDQRDVPGLLEQFDVLRGSLISIARDASRTCRATRHCRRRSARTTPLGTRVAGRAFGTVPRGQTRGDRWRCLR